MNFQQLLYVSQNSQPERTVQVTLIESIYNKSRASHHLTDARSYEQAAILRNLQ